MTINEALDKHFFESCFRRTAVEKRRKREEKERRKRERDSKRRQEKRERKTKKQTDIQLFQKHSH